MWFAKKRTLIYWTLFLSIFAYYFYGILAAYRQLSTDLLLLRPEDYPLPTLAICAPFKLFWTRSQQPPQVFAGVEVVQAGRRLAFRLRALEYSLEQICADLHFQPANLTFAGLELVNMSIEDVYHRPVGSAGLSRRHRLIRMYDTMGCDRMLRIYSVRRPLHLSRAGHPDEVCGETDCRRELLLVETVFYRKHNPGIGLLVKAPVVVLQIHQAMTTDVLCVYVLYLFGSCFGVNYVVLQLSARQSVNSVCRSRLPAKLNLAAILLLAASMVVTQSSRMIGDYLRFETTEQIRYRVSAEVAPLATSICFFVNQNYLTSCLKANSKLDLFKLDECNLRFRLNRTLATYWADARHSWPRLPPPLGANYTYSRIYIRDEHACFTLSPESEALASIFKMFKTNRHPLGYGFQLGGCTLFHFRQGIARLEQGCVQESTENYFPIFIERRLPAPYDEQCAEYASKGFLSQSHCIESCVLDRVLARHGKLPTFVSYDLGLPEHRRLENHSFVVVAQPEKLRMFAECRLRCPLRDCTRVSYTVANRSYPVVQPYMPSYFIINEITHSPKVSRFDVVLFVLGVSNFWFGISLSAVATSAHSARCTGRRVYQLLIRASKISIYLFCFWMLAIVGSSYFGQRLSTDVLFTGVNGLEIPTFIFCLNRRALSYRLPLLGFTDDVLRLPPLELVARLALSRVHFRDRTGRMQTYNFSQASPYVRVTSYPKRADSLCLKLAFNLTYTAGDLNESRDVFALEDLSVLVDKWIAILPSGRFQDNLYFVPDWCQEFYRLSIRFENRRSCRTYRHSRLEDLYLEMQTAYSNATGKVASALPLFDLHERLPVEQGDAQLLPLAELYRRKRPNYAKPDCEAGFYLFNLLSDRCPWRAHFRPSKFEILMLVRDRHSFSEFFLLVLGVLSVCINFSLNEVLEMILNRFCAFSCRCS